MSLFTTCIITVSTESRAQEYRTLIERRKNHGLYPSEIDFRVLSDPEDGKVGSGGAVLLALHHLFDNNKKFNEPEGTNSAAGRVLILNSGGCGDALTIFHQRELYLRRCQLTAAVLFLRSCLICKSISF